MVIEANNSVKNAFFTLKNKKMMCWLLLVKKYCLPLQSQNKNGKSYTASSL